MEHDSFFFSLRWKLAILFGSLFLALLTAFSFLSYSNNKSDFEKYRSKIQANHVNTLKAFTNDSFAVLEQLSELVSMLKPTGKNKTEEALGAVSSIDDRWTRWQLIWGIESVVFFDDKGVKVKSWGDPLTGFETSVQNVIANEVPENKIICPDQCFQQVIVPIMGKSEIIGVLSIVRAYNEVMIKFKNATESDLGILNGKQMSASASPVMIKNHDIAYCLCAMTNMEINAEVFQEIAKHYTIQQLSEKSIRIEYKNSVYEVFAQTVPQTYPAQAPPVYLFVDDITAEITQLNANLKQIWLYSVVGLLCILFLIVFFLHIFFRRISGLSKALPLLSAKQFNEFRHQIGSADANLLGHDEIDILSQTALILSEQLESLEQMMRGHTFTLLEKSQELAKERDFVRQLIDLAPIIIIIQRLNGIILSINQAGMDAIETDHSVVGKVFDIFMPEVDQEHINKLTRLRNLENIDEVQQDGHLLTEGGKIRDISWLHKLLPFKEEGEDKVVLTLGVDISERKITEARNIRMAYYDYLTGLGNRRKFHEEFTQKIASAERYKYQLAILYMDIDRFKEINDTSGHEAGDNFLKLVADTLKSTIRTTDLLCRLGGDEFVLLMPHSDSIGIDNIATKINSVLRNQLFTCSGKSFVPSASIGISIYPMHGISANELMANADLAMYRAKELGRGQYHLFNPDYDYRSKSNQMVHWRAIIEDAIKNDKFILVYQPILNIKKQRISHYECLVRLQQDNGQLLMPSEFVFRAEELGLISKIDRIVLKKALAQQVEFKRLDENFKLSINISRRSFEDTTIFDDFSQMLTAPGVDQSKIIFEITDNSAMVNSQSTSDLINRIKDLGCVLALNDFGIEYPSLSYLKNAPVDYVKIDGSLIRQIDKNNDDKAFVKALVEVAQAFGKKTVAEFVENENILEILKEFGIDYAQGYHIGWPTMLDGKAEESKAF